MLFTIEGIQYIRSRFDEKLIMKTLMTIAVLLISCGTTARAGETNSPINARVSLTNVVQKTSENGIVAFDRSVAARLEKTPKSIWDNVDMNTTLSPKCDEKCDDATFKFMASKNGKRFLAFENKAVSPIGASMRRSYSWNGLCLCFGF